MALSSPGVQVSVIDESFYTPAAAGTVPMIFVATASNKTSSSGVGTGVGTLAANAGKPYLITSQRELGETFGDPLFYSDANGNMIHGGELNEYGLQTAYSLLGVTNRAYVVRAELDLSKLTASAVAPGGEPANGAYWFDTLNTKFGILEWNSAAISVTGGQSFASKTPIVVTKATDIDAGTSAPKTSIGAIGDYAVATTTTTSRFWLKSKGNTAAGVTAGEWVEVGSTDWKASNPSITSTIANPTLGNGDTISINSSTVTLAGTTVTSLAADINTAAISGISAAAVDGVIEIYSTGVDIVLANGSGTILTAGGLTAATYEAPKLTIAPHTSVPQYKSTDTEPAPTGSIWIKTTLQRQHTKLQSLLLHRIQVYHSIRALIQNQHQQAVFGLKQLLQTVVLTIKLKSMQLLQSFGLQ